MNNDQQSDINDATSRPGDTSLTQQPVGAKSTNSSTKRLAIIVASIIGLLLVVLIALLAMLLTRDDEAVTNTQSDSEQSVQQSDEETSDDPAAAGREVLMRVPASDSKLEYVIYKPQQNTSNTTLYFAVENVCEGCADKTSTFSAVNGFDHRNGSYLVDDNNGKKYSTIKDQDDDVLATTNCGGFVAHGEKVECFVAFTKVPSGSTISWVFGNNRIDNIKVE